MVNRMINYFVNASHVLQALYATLFTWAVTILGAAVVIFFKRVNKNVMDAMLGFAAGVMIAASFWSLLDPSIAMANSLKMTAWLIAFIGFFSGGMLLFVGDKIFDLINKKKNANSSSFKRCLMLIFSITLHNIPEGLAVGVSFGTLAYNIGGSSSLLEACLLALGIGLQNFPEGSAVSLPLMSRRKAFFYGQLSGVVEPIAGVIGAILVIKIRLVLPFLLAFAAGAMIYVVVCELIPESQSNKKKDLMALFTLIGFSVMMILDVALG